MFDQFVYPAPSTHDERNHRPKACMEVVMVLHLSISISSDVLITVHRQKPTQQPFMHGRVSEKHKHIKSAQIPLNDPEFPRLLVCCCKRGHSYIASSQWLYLDWTMVWALNLRLYVSEKYSPELQ